MDDFTRHLNELMEDPEFKAEYDRLEPDYLVIEALIKARADQNISQKELAKRSGLKQSNLSRIETGASSPNIRTLYNIARGLGKKLHIEFR